MIDYEKYITFDTPIPYKDMLLHPVRLREYTEMYTYSPCLNLDKNSLRDINIIKMTNLEYIYSGAMSDLGIPYLIMFDRLLALCVKDDESFLDLEKSLNRYKYNTSGKPIFTIGETEYDSSDYEEIKNIIATQNSIDLIDETISKEVRDSLEKARNYRSKMGSSKPATMEDYIVALAVVTGWEFEYIYNMTVSKFNKALSRLDNYIHYKIYLSASMSGMVEFKDTSFIRHWLSNLETDDKFGGASIQLESVKDKLSFESAKK